MAGFLTNEWFDDLDEAARGAERAPDLRLVLQQIVPDGPDGDEVAYVSWSPAAGSPSSAAGPRTPDVTFTQDRATAEAIHRGELSAQTAFIEGRLRLGGDLRAVIERAGDAGERSTTCFAAARA